MVLKRSKRGFNTGNTLRYGHRLYLYRYYKSCQNAIIKKVNIPSNTKHSFTSNKNPLSSILADGLRNEENEEHYRFGYCDKTKHWVYPLEYSGNKKKRWLLVENLKERLTSQSFDFLHVEVSERQIPVRERYYSFAKSDMLRPHVYAYHVFGEQARSVFPTRAYSYQKDLKAKSQLEKLNDSRDDRNYSTTISKTRISKGKHIYSIMKHQQHDKCLDFVDEERLWTNENKICVTYDICKLLPLTSHRMHMAPHPNSDHRRQNKEKKSKNKGKGKNKLSDGVNVLPMSMLGRHPNRPKLEEEVLSTSTVAPQQRGQNGLDGVAAPEGSGHIVTNCATCTINLMDVKIKNKTALTLAQFVEETEHGFTIL